MGSKSIMIRIPRDLADQIDDVRGLAPREAYVRYLLKLALDQVDKEHQKS